jgi:dTMP kinase
MGLFITFEGSEGSGKSTQTRALYERLHAENYPVILVREPGGTRIGDMIRRIVLDLQHTEMDATTETFLFSAARAQLVNEVIRPYLAQGGIVICDRYADSTYAYQGYGLGRDLNELKTLTAIATGGLRPYVSIYLDIIADAGLERKQRRKNGALPQGVEWNRLDAREVAYHRRVADGYRALIDEDRERWFVCDAAQSIDTIAASIYTHIGTHVARIHKLDASGR